MEWFTGHKLIKEQDGYIVELNLNQRLSEFAKDFDAQQPEANGSFMESVRDYLKEKLPHIKLKSVHILLGSFLIASLPPASIYGPASSAYAQVNPTYTSYTVKYGDTLYKIASRFNTSVEAIKGMNGLTSDMIFAGQQLKIPFPTGSYYTVKPGDTLYQIASKANVTVEQLKIVNRLTGDMIYVNQSLYIPDGNTIALVNGLPDGTMSLGSRGEKVQRLQKALNALGYALIEDGIYGARTRSAILDFQSLYADLTKDGIYGSHTRWWLQFALLTDHMIVSNPDDVLVLVNKDYSLPPDYVPKELIIPHIPFSFEGYDPKKLMRRDAALALEKLFHSAAQEGVQLYGLSGYRSYNRQREIFTSKVMRDGMAKAGEYSAKPGESEHQTGLAMDVTSSSVQYGLSLAFGQTKEGKWLKANAHEYGFIIRYPKEKEHITGYKYEPWHLRYVGQKAAGELYHAGLVLEEYLSTR